jgi:two-component system, cell cycle response regulator DivK
MAEITNQQFDWKGKTVLIAEDEEINFLFIETLLLKTGVEIIHAWNGKQALDFVTQNPNINLVLMDIKMPIMDGFEATRQIKEHRPELPVIAQTAYTLGDDKIRCLDAGCDDYLSKPIRKSLLYSIIDNYLNFPEL